MRGFLIKKNTHYEKSFLIISLNLKKYKHKSNNSNKETT